VNKNNQIQKDSFDKVLLSVGIVANTENLNLNQVFVETIKDKIKVNKDYQTTNPDIYAIGDCIDTPALAHVASHEGIRASEHIYLTLKKEQKIQSNFHIEYKPINYNWIPFCTYCNPEVASIGFTEKKIKELGIEYNVGRFPFQALGRAHASSDAEGFVKVIIGKKYHNILGIHIIGKNATEIISEGLVSVYSELLADDLAKIVHPHPTISESIMEAFANSIHESINI
jgi:dihydrolipoamide dehydrogenase